MRRRWDWPLLRRLQNINRDDWGFAWFLWVVFGAVIGILPAAGVDTRASGHIYLGRYLLIMLIVYVPPVAFGLLVALGLSVRVFIRRFGHDLLPRRVHESAEDLREHYRRPQ